MALERKERFCSHRRFTKSIEKKVRYYLEQEQWSPEEIVGYCKTQHIEMVSTERIYQYVRLDKKKGWKIIPTFTSSIKTQKTPSWSSKESKN